MDVREQIDHDVADLEQRLPGEVPAEKRDEFLDVVRLYMLYHRDPEFRQALEDMSFRRTYPAVLAKQGEGA